MLLGGSDELDGDKLVATLLEAGDDVANEATLDTVWLDSDEATMQSVFGSRINCH